MSNVNRVTITGNLTDDPEQRTVGDRTLTRMRVAVDERVKARDGDGYVDRPNYFDVSVWGPQAAACAGHLHKGSKIAVDGRLRWREWDTDGKKGQAVEIVAGQVEFLDPRPGPERELVGAASGSQTSDQLADEEIPF